MLLYSCKMLRKFMSTMIREFINTTRDTKKLEKQKHSNTLKITIEDMTKT